VRGTMADDLATGAAGASVIMATCGDERHPPEHILEPNDGSFWATTGLYPQEFVIKLSGTAQVNKVRTLTSNGASTLGEGEGLGIYGGGGG
jgi:heat shock protein beta-11